MKLSSQIRYAIKLQPASSTAIAKKAGISQSAMSRLMRGGNMSLKNLDRLADVLGLRLISETRVPPARQGRPRKTA